MCAKKKSGKVSPTAKRSKAKKPPAQKSDRPRCGLCGKAGKLTKTECCDQWICDDEANYKLFSYAHNSCSRNHDRYTLCALHFNEEHPGHWKDCQKCRKGMKLEMYVYYGTNEYNFEVLENPPTFEPTKCGKCGAIIVLSEGGYSTGREGYRCGRCMDSVFG